MTIVTNWRAQLEKLNIMRNELYKNAGIMTPYERQVNGGEVQRQQESAIPTMTAGVLAEFNGAINRYRKSIDGMGKAKSAEVSRFKPETLQAELSNALTLVGLAHQVKPGAFSTGDAGARIEQIFEDAKSSGDLHKQRAAFEVLQSLDVEALKGEDRFKAATVRSQAAQELRTLRTTPEMNQAEDEWRQSLNRLFDARHELNDVSTALGQGGVQLFASGPLAQAYRRVKANNNTGELTILAEDDPEVTGIEFKLTPPEKLEIKIE